MPQELASLLSDFPRGDPDRAPPDNDPRGFKPPSAAFTKPAMIRDSVLAWEPGKLFLGVIDGVVEQREGQKFVTGGRPIGVDDNRHIVTFAGTRSGKGRAALIGNLLHYPGSVLATDPKGELAMITARRRVELGQNVHVLDPFGAAKGYPHEQGLAKGFNPIAAMRDDSLVEDAALIADALVIAGGKDPHWDESARAFIEGLILHLRTWHEFDGKASLLTLREIIGQAGGKAAATLQAKMEENDKADGAIQSAAADFFQRPDVEKGGVLSSARRHLKFLDLFRNLQNPRAQLTLERDDFRLDELKTRETTIYLCLPARHVGTCSRWLRLFVNLTMQGMEETVVDELPGGVPVLCAFDEFATAIGYLKQIEDSAALIAGFGVKMWIVLQDLPQLKALYPDRWESFLGNAGIVQCFGNNDLTTLEWISRRCGRTSIQTLRKSDMAIAEGGDSIVVEGHDLMTPDEVARFFGRDDPKFRQLVIWAGRKNPLLVLQRAYYDKHALFKHPDGRPLFDEAARNG